MNHQPSVTIASPVHNGAGLLEKFWECLRTQTIPNFKVIIFENHSTGDSLEITQRFVDRDGRFSIYPSEIFLDSARSHRFYYAPAGSAIEMAEAYLGDQKRVLPCAAHITDAYGVKDIYVGVPTVIGAGGIEKVIEIDLNKSETTMFDNSVDAVNGLVEACIAIDGSLA